MKKLIAIAAVVVLVITAFAMVGPVGAGPPAASERTVFEANIVPLDQATHPLDEGEIKVFADGSVEIKIKGAEPETTYTVYFGQSWPETIGWLVDWDLDTLGQFQTDDEGDSEFTGSIPAGQYTAPVFAINDAPDFTQFATGFLAP